MLSTLMSKDDTTPSSLINPKGREQDKHCELAKKTVLEHSQVKFLKDG
jgi:hypothetical protein